jgi:hypothetical protein
LKLKFGLTVFEALSFRGTELWIAEVKAFLVAKEQEILEETCVPSIVGLLGIVGGEEVVLLEKVHALRGKENN